MFIFGENWGYQKVLLKLSDLYFSQVWFYTILSNFVFHILEWPHVYDKIIKMNYYATILSCKYFHNAASEHMGRFGASCTSIITPAIDKILWKKNVDQWFWYFCLKYLFIPFFVFGHFGRWSYKNTKILCNLCLHFARQDGQDRKKTKENHTTKVTYNQKPKDENMGWMKQK